MIQFPDCNQEVTSLPFRSHTALLLATALPFLQPAYRHPIELIIKFLEFSETIKLYQEFRTRERNPFSSFFHDISLTGKSEGIFGIINTFITDVEGLLCSLSKVSTGDEKELIGMFLNFIRAKNFFETYGDLMNLGSLFSQDPQFTQEEPAPPPAHEAAGAPASGTAGFPSPGDFTSMLSSEQQETLNLLKNLFSTE